MYINNIKINNFGKIKNKEINLEKNINLIYGKNEAGKSTILKFINSMLYGVSKNKNGKEISDFDKFKPWNNGEYSGKLKYILDNNEEIEIFRDFTKKSPKIYNKDMEDISKTFNIDKNKGNEFFYEQTGIDENLFLATFVSEQKEIVLDTNNQKLLTQKIANILSTGADNISYKKSIEKLNKKLVSEIGTTRTIGRPINNILEQINEINLRKNNIENGENKEKEIKEEKNNLLLELNKIVDEIKLLKEIKQIKDQELVEYEKIKINDGLLMQYNEQIQNLDIKKNKKIKIIYLLLLLPINIIIYFLKTDIVSILTAIASILLIIIMLYIRNKRLENNEIIKKEKKILQMSKDEVEQKNNQILNKINIMRNKGLNALILNYKEKIKENVIIEYFNDDVKKIYEYIYQLESTKNNIELSLHKLEFDEDNIKKELEEKVELEEKLQYLNEQKCELEKHEKAILLSREILELAYKEMKNDITPQFTHNLSKIAEKISNGKYKKVLFNDEKGILIELENGEYIDTNYLSIGTIDQLYLSLRLSTTDKVTKEKLPIILDEAFAYYDDERLENIIKYLCQEYKNHQIILFTCSGREKNILDKLNIKYNLVEI